VDNVAAPPADRVAVHVDELQSIKVGIAANTTVLPGSLVYVTHGFVKDSVPLPAPAVSGRCWRFWNMLSW
jgi:hypothetical protein